MTAADLETSILTTLKAYWRIRAGLASYMLLVKSNQRSRLTLTYKELPSYGSVGNLLGAEPIMDAFSAVEIYIKEKRLALDVFYSMLGSVETFLSAALMSQALDHQGTFGQLQKRAEGVFRPPSDLVERVDEIRERRNAIVHHKGAVSSKYLQAARKVAAQNCAAPVDIGTTQLDISDVYLTYSADCFIRYTSKF